MKRSRLLPKGRPLMAGMPASTISSRGRTQTDQGKERTEFLRLYHVHADGLCTTCEAPLLFWFVFCPTCGSLLDWVKTPGGPRSAGGSEGEPAGPGPSTDATLPAS
jgi:hypothetical protein